MEVAFSEPFKKVFNKRIKSTLTEKTFWVRLELFMNNPYDAVLKTHKLSGKLKGLYAFSVEYDVRVVFYFTKDKPAKAVLVDIGSHDEVY
jgi:mRNA-degrading endonuclease YafQ of YafQ-DinJ toxin-antitoxin module